MHSFNLLNWVYSCSGPVKVLERPSLENNVQVLFIFKLTRVVDSPTETVSYCRYFLSWHMPKSFSDFKYNV